MVCWMMQSLVLSVLAATFEFDPAVVGLIVTVLLAGFTGFAAWLNLKLKPLQPNGGSSVGDLPGRVDRLEKNVDTLLTNQLVIMSGARLVPRETDV